MPKLPKPASVLYQTTVVRRLGPASSRGVPLILAPQLPPWSPPEFDELGGHVDFVGRVVDRLSAAAAHVVFVPAIAVELVLFACVSEVYTVSN
jgi:hypothetical protein